MTRPASEPLIIIKRGSPEEPTAKGGAWKIAYADFVTAMMAFFLVMWLINAANDKTKAQVASYFNPVKLTDNTIMEKGLNEPTTQSGPKSEKSAPATAEEKTAPPQSSPEKSPAENSSSEAEALNKKEQAIFQNPYPMLSNLAGETAADVMAQPPSHMLWDNAEQPAKNSGQAFSDPFDPLSWTMRSSGHTEQHTVTAEPVPAPPAEPSKSQEASAVQPTAVQKSDDSTASSSASSHPEQPDLAQTSQMQPSQTQSSQAQPSHETLKDTFVQHEPKLGETSPVTHDKPEPSQALALAQSIQQQLAQDHAIQSADLAVTKTDEGVLISLTDNLRFDMFESGSAVPNAQAIRLMEKIAQTVKNYDGKVIIRGHTDARQYKSRDYDNWRLSTARAQMAYYMLIRAGLQEASVERIEGYADRDLKDKAHPQSAENRRIEILLKAPQP